MNNNESFVFLCYTKWFCTLCKQAITTKNLLCNTMLQGFTPCTNESFILHYVTGFYTMYKWIFHLMLHYRILYPVKKFWCWLPRTTHLRCLLTSLTDMAALCTMGVSSSNSKSAGRDTCKQWGCWSKLTQLPALCTVFLSSRNLLTTITEQMTVLPVYTHPA